MNNDNQPNEPPELEPIYCVERDPSELDSVEEPKAVHYLNEDPSYLPVLELLSQRWTVNVVRSLRGGALHFNKISRDVGVNPNTLKARLVELEASGLVQRNVISVLPPRVEYSLTAAGHELSEILESVYEWAKRQDPPTHAVILESQEDFEMAAAEPELSDS